MMTITCCKIGSNNFTKLTNRLDELVKLNLKQLKDMVMTSRCEKNKKDNIDNKNDIITWSLKKFKECRSKSNGPKSGDKEEFQKQCVFWMSMRTMGNSTLLKMKLHELEVKSQLLHVKRHNRKRCFMLKQIHDVLVDACSDKNLLLKHSTNDVIEEEKYEVS